MNVKELLIKVMKPINTPLTTFILKRHYHGERGLSGTRDAKRVLVLAPHMDDETIGPGGVIRKHANQGAEIHCAFITDGSNSVSELPKEELVKARVDEINAVKSILGLTEVHFMGLPDGRVASNPESQAKLKAIIEKVKPDIIYSTMFVDAHRDHTATAEILADTLKQLRPADYIVRLYEINCAIPPDYINCIVDITDSFNVKQAAIDKFESQAIAFDGFLTLNQLKTNLVKEKHIEAAEGFIELTGDELLAYQQRLDQLGYNYPQLFKQVNRTDTLLWAIYQNYKTKVKIFEKSLP